MQQQFAPTTTTTSADTAYQVTPQEFARAAVEAETQPLSGRVSKRVSIADEQRPRATFTDGEGNAFTIDATSQELLAEVQAYRTVKHRNIAMSPFRRKELSWWLLLGGFLASSAAALGVTFFSFVLVRRNNELQMANIEMAVDAPIVGTDYKKSPLMTPERVLLSEVADNTPVYARYSDLTDLARGRLSPQQVSVLHNSDTNTAGTQQWTLLKSNGHYFVRGWRYTGAGDYKSYKDWFASIATDSSTQETSEIPIERFKNVAEPPSIVQDADGTGEEVLLPDTP